MGGIQAPMRCPACDTASPSAGHLRKHQRHGELVLVSRQVSGKWRLVWEKPTTMEGGKHAG